MVVLKILSILLLGESEPGWAALKLPFIAGLWHMFRKSGVDPRWALVPCARTYMLSRCAGREPEGRVLSVTEFLLLPLQILQLSQIEAGYLAALGDRAETVLLLVGVVDLALTFVQIVYWVRVSAGLTEVYGVSRRWIVLWLLFPFIPALVYGFNAKYQPAWKLEDIREELARAVSGGFVEAGEGLTVNLQKRTVTEFFQKKTLLRDIHLNIKPGHMVLLLGGSGAGKTTFLNAVNGYEKADEEVMLNGGNLYKQYKKMQFEIGFVPQQELMREKDTAEATLLDAAKLRLPFNVSAARRKERVRQVLEIFGLTPARHTLVEKMSGGQKKRLSIAMEFLSNPSLFILDEPDSGLDGVMARELMQQLRKIADMGKSVLVITHTPDRVIDLFDDVIVLAKDSARTGRLAFYGSIAEARAFFGREKMEEIVRAVSGRDEGGEGRADELIARFAEVQHG